MGFFGTENPVALLLAAIITFVVLRAVLGKILGATSWGSKHSDIVSVMITLIGLVVVTSLPFLRMVANTLPYIVLVGVVICLTVIAYIALGVKDKMIPLAFKHKSVNFYTWLLIGLIVVWGISLIWGPTLLEKSDTVPLTGYAEAEEQNFTFLFAKPALGFILVFSILGLTFFTVTRSVS